MRSTLEVIGEIRLGLTKAKIEAEVLGKIEPQCAVQMQAFIEQVDQLARQFSKDVKEILDNQMF